MSNKLHGSGLRTTHQNGFSLVEILVAVVIALLGIVIMFQVMDNAESRKRTTAAGGDAQVAGSISMYNLERDVRLGGYGFGNAASMGCLVNAYDASRSTAAFSFPMVPIQIVDGASGAPDQIISFYGSSALSPLSQNFDTSTTTTKKVASTSNRAGLMRGDLALIANGGNCALVEITDNTNVDQRTVSHVSGNYINSANVTWASRFNAPAGFTTTSGSIYNLGARDLPRRNIWQITNGRMLTVRDDLHAVTAANAVEIGEGIVNMQAEYGLDTTATRDYLVDTWQSTAPTDWTRVIAIRVAILSRSQQYDATNVTTTAPQWAGGSFTMTNLDGTADTAPNDPNDWRHYRYRVYEASIPLRNMIWGTSP